MGGQERLQAHEAVRDVGEQHAARGQPLEVRAHRLLGQEVDRDAVRREGVEHQQVVARLAARLLGGERAAAVAEDHPHGSGRVGEVGEQPRAARDPGHRRVDLEERPRVPRPLIRREPSDPQPDHPHARRRGAGPGRAPARHDLAHRRLGVVVGEGLAGPRRVEGLPPVDRGPVEVVAVAVALDHRVHAEEAPRAQERRRPEAAGRDRQQQRPADGGAHPRPRDRDREHDQRRRERERAQELRAQRARGDACQQHGDDRPERQELRAPGPARPGRRRGGRGRRAARVVAHQERGQKRRGRQLDHAHRQERGEQRAHHAGRQAPGRDRLVVAREVGRSGREVGEVAVQQERRQEHHRQPHRGRGPAGDVAGERAQAQDGEQEREARREDGARDQAARTARVGEHERQQVERQRHDPQQRRRRHIGGQDGRGSIQQAGRDEGEQPPAQHGRALGRLARRRALLAAGRRRGGRGGAPGPHGAGHAQQPQQRVAHAPALRLGRQRAARLDQERIGEQGHQAAEVARGVQRVGSGARRGGERRLQQRRARGERQDGRPDRGHPHGEQPQRLAAASRRRRGPPRPEHGRQRQEPGQREQRGVDRERAPRPEPADQRVRAGVARQERRLEEQQAGRPHTRRAAEDREELSSDQQLEREQQARGEQGRQGERGAHGGTRYPHAGAMTCAQVRKQETRQGMRNQPGCSTRRERPCGIGGSGSSAESAKVAEIGDEDEAVGVGGS